MAETSTRTNAGTPYTFVLVHGFWHYGELWAGVADQLRRLGHKVRHPTIKGFEQRPTKPSGAETSSAQPSGVPPAGSQPAANPAPAAQPTATQPAAQPSQSDQAPQATQPAEPDTAKPVTYAEQVASIADAITGLDLRDVVLVGHSYGGAIVAGVAQQMPERIKRVVFQNALVVRDSHSVLDEVPSTLGPWTVDPKQAEGGMAPVPPYRMWRDLLIGDADDQTAKTSHAKLRPSPLAPCSEKLELKPFYDMLADGRLQASYLNATEDITMPPADGGWHPKFSSRLGLYRLVQLLAHKLVEAARD